MKLYQLTQKLQARRDRRLVYCKERKKKDKQTVNMSGTAALMQAKAIFSFTKVAKT